MAGSTMERPARKGLLVRLMAVGICVAVGSLYATSAVQAQVPGLPSTPELPEIPAPVADAIETVQDTVVPVLIDAAIAAQPASNAAGVALRPGCATAGTAVFLIAIGGGSLPFSPGFVSTPLMLFCAAAFAPGPADVVFETVDNEAGSQVAAQVNPVLDQVGAQLAPARPNIAEACAVLSLTGSPTTYAPKPLNRLRVMNNVCGG